jgi:hypothetical protein
MTTTTLSGLETEVYSGKVMHAYSLFDIFGSRSMIYHGVTDTEKINQPLVTPGEFRFKDDDTDHAENDASIAGHEIELLIPIKQENHIMYRTVVERPQLGHLENLGKAHGTAIGEGKTVVLMNYLSDQANTAGNIKQADSSSATSILTAVDDVVAAMDELKVSGMMRFALMKPSPFYKFRGNNAVITRDFGGAANMPTLGGNLATVDYANVRLSNLGLGFGTDWTASAHSAKAIPAGYAFDMTDVIGIFWQADAWALREQEQPHSTISDIPEKQVWQVLSRMQLGTKAIQTAGIWIITESAS